MRGLLSLGAAALLAAGAAQAQAQDVGLVNLVSGEVTFRAGTGAADKVKPFMKVRDGDRFDLGKGAELRVVYFEGARQERWSGPASFRAARERSMPIKGSVAEVRALPVAATQRIARVPELMQNARLGGVQLRGARPAPGASAEKALAEARKLYAEMRKAAARNDITPELYLYAVLSEHGGGEEMRRLTTEMRRRQPDNEEIQWLEKQVR